MFNIQYLSTDARRQIEQLQKRATVDQKELELRNGKIRTIEEQAKPYTQCDLDELNDLRGQLFDKYDKLLRINKADASQQFALMIRLVDEQIQFKLMDQSERAKEKKAQEDAEKAARENRPTPTETKQGRSRWTSIFGGRTGSSSDPALD